MKSPFVRSYLAVLAVVGLAIGLAAPVRADWNPGDPSKWQQLPDLSTGMDVYDTAPTILADDFLCTFSGQITDIHFWGSWLNDQVGNITGIHVSFHSDVPASPTGGTPSHPGPELWSMNLTPGQFTIRPYAMANEPFYDPNMNEIIGDDSQVFQYNISIDPSVAFTQQVNTIYWLDIQVQVAPETGIFGWKTSNQHFGDDAVFDNTPQTNPNWRDMHYPQGTELQGQSVDLAFVLTTVPESGTVGLMVIGGLGIVLLYSRRRISGR